MLMADTMSIFFVIVGLMLAFPALWLLCSGLWPATVAAATERCGRSFWSSFIAGVPITILMIVLAKILFSIATPGGKIAGFTVVCLYLLQANAGVAGLAAAVGRKLASPIDKERPWRATLRGGLILELTYLLPILGWLGLFPASIIVGSGAANLHLLSTLRMAIFPARATLPSSDQTMNTEVDPSVRLV